VQHKYTLSARHKQTTNREHSQTKKLYNSSAILAQANLVSTLYQPIKTCTWH